LNKIDEAIAAYKHSLDLESQNAGNWNKVGNLYYNLGNFEAAIECYNRAIESDPSIAVYYKNRGLANRKREKWDEVIINYSKAPRIESE
jgi:tetratricopeptide (TPR) repeat protein